LPFTRGSTKIRNYIFIAAAVLLFGARACLSQSVPGGDLPENLIPGAEVTKAGEFSIKQFLSPKTCGSCHGSIYEQWKGSVHNQAFADPIWQSVAKLFVREATTDYAKADAQRCVRCHAPVAYVTGQLKTTDGDFSKVRKVGKLGISCDFCHSVEASAGIGNASYIVQPGKGPNKPGIKRAQFEDSRSPFHDTARSELHTRSEFCGMCHEVSHVVSGLGIERTYTEWREGPYHTGDPKTTVHCQDCHMRQKPGVPATGMTDRPDHPGQACDMGPERPHIFTHYFVGANAGLPALMGSKAHSEMAIERLKHAATLELISPKAIQRGQLAEIKIKVTNAGAGHYLPTGLTEVRQMWLHMVVTDAKGKKIFESGAVDAQGKVDENAVMYHAVLGGPDGKPVANVAKATRLITDYRIPPKGRRIEKISLVVPPDAAGPIKVHAVLRYRSAPQEVLNAVMKDKAPTLPIIDMVKTEGEIAVER